MTKQVNKSNTARAKRNFSNTPVWEVQIFDGKRITDSITVIGDPSAVTYAMLGDRMWALAGGGLVQDHHVNAAHEQVQLKRVGVV